MKKLTLLILACLVAFNIAEAQITRQQADAIVTNQIFSSSLDNVDIYAFPDLLTSHDEITLADGTSIAVPYQTCYAYFVDLMPFANWSHPCKYCFVNSSSRQTIVEADMLPIQEDLVSISLVQRNHPNPDFVIPENASGRSFEAENTEHKWGVLICGNANGNGAPKRFWFDLSFVYTVLANTYHYQESTTWLDTQNRRIFVSAGFNIRDMYRPIFQNDEYPDLNGNNTPLGDFLCHEGSSETITYHTKSNLHKLFKCFADGSFQEDYEDHGYGLRQLTEEDQLFIFITGHGQRDNYGSYFVVDEDEPSNDNKIYDYQLAEWLRDIKCSQITLMMENCYSGGFVEKFYEDIDDPRCQCKNRVGFSAASADGISYTEGYGVHNYSNRYDHTCGNINEFVYYWASAALGYYPFIQINADGIHFDWGAWNPSGRNIADGTMNWRDYFGNKENIKPHADYEEDPDTDHDEILSFKELFEFANNLDSWTWDGYYYPNVDTLNSEIPYQPEFPQSAYESSFTAEAATLVGYQGQVDGDVTSGSAEQPYRLCGDLWTGPHTRVDMTDDIYVPEGNKIYIQPSSYIHLGNCTVDKLPESNGMWEGFQVWGQSGEPQDLQHQGALYMDNASIRNAVVAVDLWHPNYWYSMGGTIRANNSSFINNGKAIHALNCVYESTAFMPTFSNCRFYVGNDNGETYFGPTTFYKHVDLANVRGVKFYGCDFGLDCVNSFISDWTIGIAAYNSGFEVEKLNSKRSTFNGFFRGVQALNDNNGLPEMFSVKNSTFTNNDYGIFARAADVPVILNNTFSIGLDNWYSCSAAIQLEGIASFVVEGNSITKAPDCTNDNFGIIIKDSQTEGNQVYLNDLDGLYCGNLAWGNNRSIDRERGIEYICNSNANNVVDFYVKKKLSTDINSDIQQNQGNLVAAAQNTFSPNNESSNLRYNFYNDGNNTVHYYVYQYSGDDVYPHIVNGSKVFVNDKSTQANTCQPHYGGGGNAHNGSSTPVLSTAQKQQRQTDYANALSTYNSVKNVYDRLTDGGSTNTTVADIRSALPSDMWELRSKLLGSSPYLSEEVLKETADRDDVFTESILFEILASNPDELRKGDIIKYVEDKEHPLPEYMVDILRQLSTGTTTYKTVLLNSMASSRHDYRQAAADMVRSIMADSIVDMAELRGWLANMNDLSADRQIISTYMAEGDFGTAFSLANMLPVLYEFDETALAEHDDYMELLGLYRDLHNDGRSTLQLMENETEDVEDIAVNGTGLPQYMAQSLLEATNERYHFAECPELDFPLPSKGASQGYTQEDLSKAMGLSVSAKPNPATTWVALDYTLPGDAKAAAVEIVNSLGEKVMQSQLNGNVGQKVLDLRELSNGVYTIAILCGEHCQTEKLVITK